MSYGTFRNTTTPLSGRGSKTATQCGRPHTDSNELLLQQQQQQQRSELSMTCSEHIPQQKHQQSTLQCSESSSSTNSPEKLLVSSERMNCENLDRAISGVPTNNSSSRYLRTGFTDETFTAETFRQTLPGSGRIRSSNFHSDRSVSFASRTMASNTTQGAFGTSQKSADKSSLPRKCRPAEQLATADLVDAPTADLSPNIDDRQRRNSKPAATAVEGPLVYCGQTSTCPTTPDVRNNRSSSENSTKNSQIKSVVPRRDRYEVVAIENDRDLRTASTVDSYWSSLSVLLDGYEMVPPVVQYRQPDYVVDLPWMPSRLVDAVYDARRLMAEQRDAILLDVQPPSSMSPSHSERRSGTAAADDDDVLLLIDFGDETTSSGGELQSVADIAEFGEYIVVGSASSAATVAATSSDCVIEMFRLQSDVSTTGSASTSGSDDLILIDFGDSPSTNAGSSAATDVNDGRRRCVEPFLASLSSTFEALHRDSNVLSSTSATRDAASAPPAAPRYPTVSNAADLMQLFRRSGPNASTQSSVEMASSYGGILDCVSTPVGCRQSSTRLQPFIERRTGVEQPPRLHCLKSNSELDARHGSVRCPQVSAANGADGHSGLQTETVETAAAAASAAGEAMEFIDDDDFAKFVPVLLPASRTATWRPAVPRLVHNVVDMSEYKRARAAVDELKMCTCAAAELQQIQFPAATDRRFSSSVNRSLCLLDAKPRTRLTAVAYYRFPPFFEFSKPLLLVKTELAIAALQHYFYPCHRVNFFWVSDLAAQLADIQTRISRSAGGVDGGRRQLTVKFGRLADIRQHRCLLVLSSDAAVLLRHGRTAFLASLAAALDVDPNRILVVVRPVGAEEDPDVDEEDCSTVHHALQTSSASLRYLSKYLPSTHSTSLPSHVTTDGTSCQHVVVA